MLPAYSAGNAIIVFKKKVVNMELDLALDHFPVVTKMMHGLKNIIIQIERLKEICHLNFYIGTALSAESDSRHSKNPRFIAGMIVSSDTEL